MIVVQSLIRGVKQHFTIRLSEWIMLYPAIGMWAGLTFFQPQLFTMGKSFTALSAIASEKSWAAVVLACAVARFSALVINGTFDTFKYSPHVRAAASIMGLLFWSQFSVGFLYAYLNTGGSISAVVAYSTFVVVELANLYRSAKDIGSTYADAKRRQNGMGL